MDKSKLAIGVALGVFVGLVTYSVITFVAQKTGVPLRGISYDSVEYGASGVTLSNSICGVQGLVILAATSTQRTSFIATNNGSSSVYICKANSCAPQDGRGAGILIGPTSTGNSAIYEQSDGYKGPWSCGTVSGSSSVNVQISQ